jgi:hypothetical protein
MPISVRDIFERRLGLFPSGFTPDGQLFATPIRGERNDPERAQCGRFYTATVDAVNDSGIN